MEPMETTPAGMTRVGVAGWDYSDWVGPVYPADAGRGFDRLAWISRFVDTVEVNSSFYRPVAPRVAASWLRRTCDRPGFLFTAKAHRSWTHEPERDLDSAVASTLEGLRPLREAGRLGALLVQFPQSFHFTRRATARIERLLERAAGWPVVVEVRHASWEPETAASWFAAREAGWCCVDQPRIGRSTARRLARVTGPVAYMRLHGRNRADWFRPEAGRDARYDYLYTTGQLDELAGEARRMAAAAKTLFVIQNNHFRGQALVNALQLKRMLEGSAPPAPAELVATYPELAPDVAVERSGLF